MAYEEIQTSKNVEKIYVFPADNPKKRRLAYKINKAKEEVTFYPEKWFFVNRIYIQGFTSVPPEFSLHGYIKQGVVYYLNKMLSDKDIERLIISTDSDNQFKKNGNSYIVTINYNSFKRLKNNIAAINNESKFEKSHFVDEFFHDLFPQRYSKVEVSSRRRATRVMKNLDDNIVEHLEKTDVEKLLDFFETLLSTKYTSATRKRQLLNSAKIKVDDVAITEVIEIFEQMLADDPAESKWGIFLKRNLFLIDSKYVYALPELNVVLANYRKVDFGLVDAQGYLDIFEIKKPSTKLLAGKTDRGNHYWSTDAVKAIVQAEKYMFHTERKATNLAEDIVTQRKKKVEVIKPRAFVLIGNSDQLDDEDKRRDFRVLRMSLKNVEVMLYDELLERIKNQKNKIYIE